MHPLDHPVRASLFSEQAHLARGDALARRFQPDVHLFAATRDDSESAGLALARLLEPGERVTLMRTGQPNLPDNLSVLSQRPAVLLLATTAIAAGDTRQAIVALSGSDADAMQSLAELTRPGPFARNTWEMGQFFGVRIDGRLAAMAGVRLQSPGFVEVSGVCTHPDFRGRGLATNLSRHVAAQVQARGLTPFLHAWHDNAAAIALYQHLGFHYRAELLVTVVERPQINVGPAPKR